MPAPTTVKNVKVTILVPLDSVTQVTVEYDHINEDESTEPRSFEATIGEVDRMYYSSRIFQQIYDHEFPPA